MSKLSDAISIGFLAVLTGDADLWRIAEDAVTAEQRFNDDIENLCTMLNKSRDEILGAFRAFPGDWYDFRHFLLNEHQVQPVDPKANL